MQLLRSALRIISGGLFRLCLLFLPPLLAGVMIFGSPKHIEQALTQSGAYDNFVTAVLDESAKASQTDPQAQLLLQDSGVREAVISTFPPQLLRTYTESVIHGTYDWLTGRTTKPSFTIDLSQPKQQLATDLTAYVTQRANTLPACTTEQLSTLPAELNMLNIPCLPPGFDIRQAAQQFSDDVMRNTDFLQNAQLTADSLPKDSTGTALYAEQLSTMPIIFQWTMLLPWIYAIGAFVCGALFVWTSTQRKAALRSIAWTLVVSGAFWLMGVLSYALLVHDAPQLPTTITNDAFRTSMSTLFTSLSTQFNKILGFVGIGYVIVGTVGVVATRNKPVAVAATHDTQNTPSPEDHDAQIMNSAQHDATNKKEL